MKEMETRTVVIGSGCAGLNAADWLYDLGERDFILLTEDMNSGTSRNTGSDKQTYYKLSLAGDERTASASWPLLSGTETSTGTPPCAKRPIR